jgi:uncharacterized membrane protein YgdD (TMEM256/DUF423 family)
MSHQQHSTFGEGLLAGLIGGLVVAAWYLAFDIGRGEPLHTPNVLGQVFVGLDTMPTVRRIVPGAVLQYSLLHFAFFFALGIGLTAVTHLAARNPALRMGVWIGLVVGFLFFLGLLRMLSSATDQRFPVWASVGGSILGIGSMGYYLWRRHPGLRSTFDQASLGDEVRSPPHPPGASHADRRQG